MSAVIEGPHECLYQAGESVDNRLSTSFGVRFISYFLKFEIIFVI